MWYSYDTRGAHSEEPSHWKDDEILESRASFRRKGEPDELLINPVMVSKFILIFLFYIGWVKNFSLGM